MENQEKPIDLSFRSTPSRPLLGLTILLVEDSRFACEAMRIMALRSGARLRRADCLTSARRHMRLYRPSVVIVDIGLPDGSGLDLIREISDNHPRVPAIIGTSGDDMMHGAAVKAGADAFFAKPYDSIAAFQSSILNLFPFSDGSWRPRVISNDLVRPDPAVYRDDLCHAKTLLEQQPSAPMKTYLCRFLDGVAQSAGDGPMAIAAQSGDIAALGELIDRRINQISAI
ncbi:response regulator [Rhodobacteraceae bacterium]|nr:response regulator [Paracoccaceae bacterium]